MNKPTAAGILAELQSPENEIKVVFCRPESVEQKDYEEVKDDARQYIDALTPESVQGWLDEVEREWTDTLQAASEFLDDNADHSVYQTITIKLERP